MQSPTNPLDVTYTFSADATETAGAVTTDLATADALPAGVLNFYSQGILECSVNVGGSVSSSACVVTYPAYGTYQVTTEYLPTGATPVTETDSEMISAPVPLPITISASLDPGSAAPNYIFDVGVTDADGPVVPLAGAIKFVSTTTIQIGSPAEYGPTPIFTATTEADGQTSCTLADVDGTLTSPDCVVITPGHGVGSFPALDGTGVVALFSGSYVDMSGTSAPVQYP